MWCGPLCAWSPIKAPIRRPFLLWLLACCNVRGTYTNDWAHRYWNSLRAALRLFDLWLVVQEFVYVLNGLHAPYQEDSFWWKITQAGAHYMKSRIWEDQLFQHLFDYIVWLSGWFALGHGSERHMRGVWGAGAIHPAVQTEG